MSETVNGDTQCECENNASEPCAVCRREIHEGWHAKGWFWIRPEECSPSCPGWPNIEMTKLRAALQKTMRDRAMDKQLKQGGPFEPSPEVTDE